MQAFAHNLLSAVSPTGLSTAAAASLRCTVLALAAAGALIATPAAGATDTAGAFPGFATAAPESVPGSAIKVAQASPLMIVYFKELPLARYAGGIEGLEPTSPTALGKPRLDSRSPAARAYLAYLDRRQDEYLTLIGKALQRRLEPVYRYRALTNGVALAISPAEGRAIEQLAGVERVVSDRVAKLDTDRGPRWIGADTVWTGTATGGLPGTYGEGIVVAILDSGINMDHPSFAAVGDDGYAHVNPSGSGVFLGWCNPAHPDFSPGYVCNDKLIGAWDYSDDFCAVSTSCSEADGPEDDSGHGSHTASTAAGNVLFSASIPGTIVSGLPISGVAPHANVIAYDVCFTNTDGDGWCPFSATSAAADQALLDGVDVLNYSISGGRDPWGLDIDRHFLELVGAGTFVAASAGNSGPGTVAHLGPWVITSGASTHDRGAGTNQLVGLAGGTGAPGSITGASLTLGYGPAPIVFAGNFSNGDADPGQCLNPFPAGTWSGNEIVLCNRGWIARVQKCANVAAGGAGGCVLANVSAESNSIAADPHVIPAIHVDLAAGNALRAWLATGPSGHTATITPAAFVGGPASADIMASFSSTGPNLAFDVLKPDVTAPGVEILAAVNSRAAAAPPEFGVLRGTSMSSPHTAGAGALLAALYPDWSPAEIRSALMLTARSTVFKPDGATPADVTDHGAGRVDLSRAARSGLILDESYAAFLAADPAVGGRPEQLNLASLQDSRCVLGCSWMRTFDATTGDLAGPTWSTAFVTPPGIGLTATPTPFSLGVGGSQTLTFTLDLSSRAIGETVSAAVQLIPDDGGPTLQLPIWARAAAHNLNAELAVVTKEPTGTHHIEGLKVAEAITDLTLASFGFTEGVRTDFPLFQDPTPDDAIDDLGQVFLKTVVIPAGARALIVTTESGEAPDVDLFLGTGATPTFESLECVSAAPAATERCLVRDPAPGTWWILVQGFRGSTSQPDAVELVDAVVSGDTGGSLVTWGPVTVAPGAPFDIAVTWDLVNERASRDSPLDDRNRPFFGVFSVAADAVSPPIESVFVTLELTSGLIFRDGFE